MRRWENKRNQAKKGQVGWPENIFRAAIQLRNASPPQLPRQTSQINCAQCVRQSGPKSSTIIMFLVHVKCMLMMPLVRESFRTDFHYFYMCFCKFAFARLRARRAYRKATIMHVDAFTIEKSWFLKSANACQSARQISILAARRPLANI